MNGARIIPGAALALALCTQPLVAQPALSVQDAATRLVTMDAELTQCWRARALVAVIAVQYLRQCIADRRAEERRLKDELNKRIGAMGTDDPLRKDFIKVRGELIDWGKFTKGVDAALKEVPEPFEYAQFDVVLDQQCDRLDRAVYEDARQFDDAFPYLDTPIPSACEENQPHR